jgi:hypothetical protein
MKAQRAVLRGLADVLEGASPAVRRVLGEETGADIEELQADARRVLG